MDEMLLNELYGNVASSDDEMVKLAQAEFVEQSAIEAGIDIDSLNDDELASFAEYVLNQGYDDGELNKYASYEEDNLTNEQYAVALAMQDIATAWDMELDGEGFSKIASSQEALDLLAADEPELAYIQMLDSYEFAKEAEYRASELLLSYGIDPVTLEDCEPEYVKIASFPGIDDASSTHSAEVLHDYNEKLDTAASYIINQLIESIFN